MTVYHLSSRIVDTADYPPEPVLLALNVVDTLCMLLQCSDWRETLRVPEGSWLSYSVPRIASNSPPLLSYSEFLEGQPAGETAWCSLSNMYSFAFRTDSTVLGDVSYPQTFGIVLALLLCLRQVSTGLTNYFSYLGQGWAKKTRGEEWVKNNPETIQKFGEFAYQLGVHSLLAVIGFIFFLNEEWWKREGIRFPGTKSLFENGPNQPIAPYMAFYYILQAAFNLDFLCSLVTLSFVLKMRWPVMSTGRVKTHFGSSYPVYDWQSPVAISWSKRVRGDFKEMAFHDILTNCLVLGSSLCRLTRAGSMVSFIHDISAVPVKISKMSNFMKWDELTVASFSVMLVTWFITRLYILPLVLFYSIVKYHHLLLDNIDAEIWLCYHNIFMVGMAGLCLLQLHWFISYCKIYVRMLKKRWQLNR